MLADRCRDFLSRQDVEERYGKKERKRDRKREKREDYEENDDSIQQQ